MLLDHFYETVGNDRINVPKARGLTFYQVLSLASIVEQEAVQDEERPLIAGVYQNRLNKKMILGADPTVIYGNDTVQLRRRCRSTSGSSSRSGTSRRRRRCRRWTCPTTSPATRPTSAPG